MIITEGGELYVLQWSCSGEPSALFKFCYTCAHKLLIFLCPSLPCL